jgi:hypothetical protein
VAILTTVASIIAAYLDEVLRAETAFLPKRLNAITSKNQDHTRIRRCRFWRTVLERLIIALADQQLVTGFAILITGWIVYHEDIYGAHFALAIYLSSLSSSSHLAAIVTLREYFNDNPALALLRIGFISAFALGLAISITLSDAFQVFYFVFWYLFEMIGPGNETSYYDAEPVVYVFIIWPILWAFWTGIWQIVPEARDRFISWVTRKLWLPTCSIGRHVCFPLNFVQYRIPTRVSDRLRKYARATLHYMVFLSPGTVFVLQIVFAAISVAMALAQKFSPGDPGTNDCSLNSQEENMMGHGQILVFLMLVLPIIAIVEAYKGKHWLSA